METPGFVYASSAVGYGKLHTYVCAVFDDDCVRHLGNGTVSAPGHVCTGEAVEGHGSELGDHSVADRFVIHRSGIDAGCGSGLIQCIDAVIAVCCELVGDLTELFLILRYEVLVELGIVVCGVRSEYDYALGQGGVEAFHGEDAVHAVNAEPGGSIACCVGLVEDEGSGFVVHGQEYEVCAGFLALCDLYGEVRSPAFSTKVLRIPVE